MKEEKVIVIDINLTRGPATLLTLALLAAAFLGYLAWNRGEAAASGPQASPAAPLASSAGLRQYYLTKTSYDGAHALTACASGYHMASMWEIVDPSNLRYNTTLGSPLADSGQGPPLSWGWVRTGSVANTGSIAGLSNCNAWTSSFDDYYGSFAELPWGWLPGGGGPAPPNFDIWYVGAEHCSYVIPVWCVEDTIIYLPLIMRNG